MSDSAPPSAQYVVGIDLGTTNTVLAYAPLGGEQCDVKILSLPQLVAAGTVEPRESLPSFLYLATQAETDAGAMDLPWSERATFGVGEIARRQGAETPDRTVGAAKSWLSHSKVDRRQPILPWGAGDDVPKISPVAASQRYLDHVAAAWNQAFPDAPLAEQQVVLTVPASFDAGARELTREAALGAGLPSNLVLLEEPQAAVYSWLQNAPDQWRKQLKVGEHLLVCDVGGGTTDLTLVRVDERDGELELRRLAVGNHLLVGGDNMDLTLAFQVSADLETKGVKLDPWQSVSLWHSCRAAKERVLDAAGPDQQTITVQGRGRKLIGGAVSADVTREAASQLLCDGFFPTCQLTDRPRRQRSSGFQEVGLPFESDTGITRHIAAFLQAHGDESGDENQPIRPARLLLNGGVFQSPTLRGRLVEVLQSWFPDAPPQLIGGEQDLNASVARGAAYYGWAKSHGGVRIRGGTARSYYVGIETAGLAVPGAPRPLRALCVAPFGMEEGTETDVPSQQIGLVVGETAHFRFFSSSIRKHDAVGAMLDRWSEDELTETTPVEATLPADESLNEPFLPVQFHAKVTELGMLELWCFSTTSDEQWKLEFSVREEDE
ncbi:MAG: Hsp70 family protein [Planctomycetales bacterium]|nr:Hsp70 family protein [Planctomycetales bacterium]